MGPWTLFYHEKRFFYPFFDQKYSFFCIFYGFLESIFFQLKFPVLYLNKSADEFPTIWDEKYAESDEYASESGENAHFPREKAPNSAENHKNPPKLAEKPPKTPERPPIFPKSSLKVYVFILI
jgi:hypothetical protein